MEREILYKVTENAVLPSTKQWGGMQYEDNATGIAFDISEIITEDVVWRIDFDSAGAGYNPSENLTVENGRVSRFIPYDMTRCGGEIQVTLVGTLIDGLGKAARIVYSVPVTVYLTEVERHEESEDKVALSVSAAEKSALDAADRSARSADEAEQSAEAAKSAQIKTEESMLALEAGSTVIFQGGNASSRFAVDIAVDGEMSEASENPVQNRAVFERFEEQDLTDADLSAQIIALKELVNKGFAQAKLDAHPVGSFYISENSTSPVELFGGEWERIKDTFLLSAGDTYAAGSTGGEAQVTLTPTHIPNILSRYTLEGASNNTGTDAIRLCASDNSANAYTGSHSGATAHNNMPPYLAVYMWKRTA